MCAGSHTNFIPQCSNMSGSASKLRAGNIRRGPLFEAGFDTDLSFMLFELDGDELHFQVISRLTNTVDKGVVRRRVVPTTTQ